MFPHQGCQDQPRMANPVSPIKSLDEQYQVLSIRPELDVAVIRELLQDDSARDAGPVVAVFDAAYWLVVVRVRQREGPSL